MVISRLLRATMVAGDSAPDKGLQPSPSGGSVRADAAANTAADGHALTRAALSHSIGRPRDRQIARGPGVCRARGTNA